MVHSRASLRGPWPVPCQPLSAWAIGQDAPTLSRVSGHSVGNPSGHWSLVWCIAQFRASAPGPVQPAREHRRRTQGTRMTNSRATTVVAASAAALAAMAFFNRADARRAERKDPPQGHFVQAGGVRLHYIE